MLLIGQDSSLCGFRLCAVFWLWLSLVALVVVALLVAGWWLLAGGFSCRLSLVALVVDAFSSGWLVALVVAGGFDLVVAGAVALVIVTLLVLGGWL